MSKIQVTESELKQVIKESVESMLKEARWNNYGMNWDQLSDAEKQAYAQRYGNSAGAYQYVDQNGNQYKGGGYAPGAQYTQQVDYNKLGEYYKQQQAKKGRKANRNGFSANYVQQLQNQLNTKTAECKTAVDGMTKIAQALGIQTPAAAAPAGTAPKTMTAENTVPQAGGNGLQQILTAINNLKAEAAKAAQLTKANQTLTAKNKQLTAQNQSLATRIQNGQNKVVAPTTAAPTAIAATNTPAAGLAGPRPGTAQA